MAAVGLTGPWIPNGTLYSNSGVSILTTTDPKWLVKTFRGAAWAELEFITRVANGEHPIRHMVELPEKDRSGSNILWSWYAMRRYDTTVSLPWGRKCWKQLARTVLEFLEDLHRGHGLVHMDIKLPNLLVDLSANTCVVAAYELVGPPTMNAAREFSDDYYWYFVGFGAEPDKPLTTWRMDFLMLGYTLAELLWDTETFGTWRFSAECDKRRKGLLPDKTDREIIELRAVELLDAHPVVRDYLATVARLVPWDSTGPPTASVYQTLRDLFLD